MANPVVTFEMENGDIMKAELYPELAPNTVKNFVSLVSKGYYDGLIFHRVIRGFMIQGGCPEGTGTGGPGYNIMHEKSPHLDGAYAAFGKIIEGMDVVNKIAETPTSWGDKPMEPQVMKRVTVETFGEAYEEPEKA